MTPSGPCQGGRPAIVVFSDRADLAWLRLLRRGFRHCFVVVAAGDHWIVCESLATGTVLDSLPACSSSDLAGAYRAAGHRTVVTTCRPMQRMPLPWAPFTCVESVKRILGVRRPLIATPFQLWNLLMKK